MDIRHGGLYVPLVCDVSAVRFVDQHVDEVESHCELGVHCAVFRISVDLSGMYV